MANQSAQHEQVDQILAAFDERECRGELLGTHSADRSRWRPGSRRSLSAKPGTDGRFVFTDVPAGEYFLAALTDLDPAGWQTAAFLEQVAPAALKLVVAEGEKKVQDLKIR